MERRLNSGNAFYHSVQNLLSSRLLCKNIKIRIYRTIILPAVLCGCGIWSLTLMEKHRMRVLRRIFWQKRVEMTEGWRKLHNEKLHNLYSSSSTIRMIMSRRMKWAGYVARMGEAECNTIWVGKPEGKRPLWRTRRRWVNNIEMDFREIEWGGMDCIDLAQDKDHWKAFVNTVMNLRVP
jgi:hypothetical protein